MMPFLLQFQSMFNFCSTWQSMFRWVLYNGLFCFVCLFMMDYLEIAYIETCELQPREIKSNCEILTPIFVPKGFSFSCFLFPNENTSETGTFLVCPTSFLILQVSLYWSIDYFLCLFRSCCLVPTWKQWHRWVTQWQRSGSRSWISSLPCPSQVRSDD
jgi:hypothetical protein